MSLLSSPLFFAGVPEPSDPRPRCGPTDPTAPPDSNSALAQMAADPQQHPGVFFPPCFSGCLHYSILFLYHGYVVPERCPHCFPSVLAKHQCCCDMLILIMVVFFLFKVPSILSAFLLSTPQNFVSKNAACIPMLFRMQFGMFQSH